MSRKTFSVPSNPISRPGNSFKETNDSFTEVFIYCFFYRFLLQCRPFHFLSIQFFPPLLCYLQNIPHPNHSWRRPNKSDLFIKLRPSLSLSTFSRFRFQFIIVHLLMFDYYYPDLHSHTHRIHNNDQEINYYITKPRRAFVQHECGGQWFVSSWFLEISTQLFNSYESALYSINK